MFFFIFLHLCFAWTRLWLMCLFSALLMLVPIFYSLCIFAAAVYLLSSNSLSTRQKKLCDWIYFRMHEAIGCAPPSIPNGICFELFCLFCFRVKASLFCCSFAANSFFLSFLLYRTAVKKSSNNSRKMAHVISFCLCFQDKQKRDADALAVADEIVLKW